MSNIFTAIAFAVLMGSVWMGGIFVGRANTKAVLVQAQTEHHRQLAALDQHWEDVAERQECLQSRLQWTAEELIPTLDIPIIENILIECYDVELAGEK